MIDLCVVINGTNLDVLVPLFFETLKAECNLEEVVVHVVLKDDVPDNVRDYISSQAIVVYEVPFITEETGWQKKPVFWSGGDTALTCDYIMNNCGENKWKVISHFDLYFKKDIIAFMKPYMIDEMALVGLHNTGICAINKDAYDQAFIGFQSITGFYAVPLNDGNGAYKIIHGSDPRCTDKSIRIEGFDVCELMEMNFRGKMWDTKWFNRNELSKYFYHIVEGSGYNGNELTAKNQRIRAISYLNKFNIQPIK